MNTNPPFPVVLVDVVPSPCFGTHAPVEDVFGWVLAPEPLFTAHLKGGTLIEFANVESVLMFLHSTYPTPICVLWVYQDQEHKLVGLEGTIL